MDVWMKRAMSQLYPGKTKEYFGPYAGIAQQYLFHYCRNHPALVVPHPTDAPHQDGRPARQKHSPLPARQKPAG